MEQKFHSNGKLLLTGEYLVLDGAKALALPTKKGQSLHIKEHNNSNALNWKSYDCHKALWYETEISTDSFFNAVPPKGISKLDDTLFKIIWEALQLNPAFLNAEKGYKVSAHLQFERLWGLGTSSTLINNIAQWAGVNAFELLHNSFGGSGYDIAAAQTNEPIFYQLTENNYAPLIKKAPKLPTSITNHLYFVYLENKKDSKEAINTYKSIPKNNLTKSIDNISAITDEISQTTSIVAFMELLQRHENIISKILGCKTIQNERFPDFVGVVKSLGGWGGDFVMVAQEQPNTDYFKRRGYTTIIPYAEMVF